MWDDIDEPTIPVVRSPAAAAATVTSVTAAEIEEQDMPIEESAYKYLTSNVSKKWQMFASVSNEVTFLHYHFSLKGRGIVEYSTSTGVKACSLISTLSVFKGCERKEQKLQR